MKKVKIVLIISLIVNLVLISGGSLVLYKKGGFEFLKKQVSTATSNQEFPPYYLQKVSIYKTSPVKNVDVAFIGDSITDHGEWNELFPEKVVINRGISNDNTNGVLNRLDEIAEKKPKKIFILIGINDLLYNTDANKIVSNYKRIVKGLKEQSPNSELYIQSVLPVNNEIYGSSIKNEDVKSINSKLKIIAKNEDIPFIDLYSALSKNDQLEEKYTIDGIHLKGAGYEVWKKQIDEFLE
ncbi:GDSL-type esterase/lipase family protein [Priestia megaterium]|uniref:GDSL-type esterase/lipase family protein n=1 Tax=Priestia megaterium TaxID=1404 RepID=UPI002FFD838C